MQTCIFLQLSNRLTSSIHHVSRWTNPTVEYSCCQGSDSIGKTEEDWQLCRTTIVTFSEKTKFIGLTNTSQFDKKDKYKKSIQSDLERYCSKLEDEKSKQYLSSNIEVGIGKPTTCAYQFLNYVNEDKDGTVFQYFLYDSFKIAIRLHDFSCKTFYGHMACHRTALPVLVRDGKVIYRNSNISVFVWGKS